VRVTVQYFDGCPHWQVADQRLKTVLAVRRDDIHVEYQLIDSAEKAEQAGFHGSPSILIDGHDPFVTGEEPIGLTCRVFHTERGREGSPSEDQLRAALKLG
jgi:hypothetical protein